MDPRVMQYLQMMGAGAAPMGVPQGGLNPMAMQVGPRLYLPNAAPQIGPLPGVGGGGGAPMMPAMQGPQMPGGQGLIQGLLGNPQALQSLLGMLKGSGGGITPNLAFLSPSYNPLASIGAGAIPT